MLVPIEAVQREDYSDIEKRQTNYENVMKDVDKHALVRNLYANNSYITHGFIKNINKSSPNSTTENSNSQLANKQYSNSNSHLANKRYSNNAYSTNSVKPTQYRQTLRVSNYNPLRKKFYGFSLYRNRTRKVAYR
jgi:hypothetical protein